MYTVYINDQIAYYNISQEDLKEVIFELVEINYGKSVKITWKKEY